MSRKLGVDLTPLRVNKQYRRLYIAGFVTALGSQATYVAVPFQLRLLTHSTLDVGSIGLAELLPLIVFGLYGGVLRGPTQSSSTDHLDGAGPHDLHGGSLRQCVLTASASLDPLRRRLRRLRRGSLQRPSIEALNQMFVPHDLQRSASALANIRSTTASIIGRALGDSRPSNSVPVRSTWRTW